MTAVKTKLNILGVVILSTSLGVSMYAITDSALGGVVIAAVVVAIALLIAADNV